MMGPGPLRRAVIRALMLLLVTGSLFLGPVGSAFAAPGPDPAASDVPALTVTTRLEPEPSYVGDRLNLDITVALPAGYTANLPTNFQLPPLEVVAVEEGPVEPTGQGTRKTFRVVLQQFETGEVTIPDFPLTYVDATGNVETTQVGGRTFQVELLTANEPDPSREGEDALVSPTYPNVLAATIFFTILATLALATLAFILIVLLRLRRKEVPVAPPVPAHEIALAALDRLEAEREGMLEEHRHIEFYLELTEIAKAYIERRFGIDALDRTTDELRRDLVAAPDRLSPCEPKTLVRFFEDCDLVKFARFAPPGEETQRALGFVRKVVVETRPRPDAEERAMAERPVGLSRDEPASAEPPPEAKP